MVNLPPLHQIGIVMHLSVSTSELILGYHLPRHHLPCFDAFKTQLPWEVCKASVVDRLSKWQHHCVVPYSTSLSTLVNSCYYQGSLHGGADTIPHMYIVCIYVYIIIHMYTGTHTYITCTCIHTHICNTLHLKPKESTGIHGLCIPGLFPMPRVHLKVDQRAQRNNLLGMHLNVSWDSYFFELFDLKQA